MSKSIKERAFQQDSRDILDFVDFKAINRATAERLVRLLVELEGSVVEAALDAIEEDLSLPYG